MIPSMPRPSVPLKTLNENAFAIRIRILTPQYGLRCLDEMHVWLREKTQGDYALNFDSANSREFGSQEFALLYVNDAAIAAACIKKFRLVLSGMPKHPL
jgi:hypothetical protein